MEKVSLHNIQECWIIQTAIDIQGNGRMGCRMVMVLIIIIIGVLQYNNGDYYEGEWVKGVQNGRGKINLI